MNRIKLDIEQDMYDTDEIIFYKDREEGYILSIVNTKHNFVDRHWNEGDTFHARLSRRFGNKI